MVIDRFWMSPLCCLQLSPVPGSLRTRKKNTSLHVTLQGKARFIRNCSGTNLVQAGPGELRKTNAGRLTPASHG